MVKLQINYRFYVKPDINHNDTNYKTTTLSLSKLKAKC